MPRRSTTRCSIAIVAMFAFVAPMASAQASIDAQRNFLDKIGLPVAEQDSSTKEITQRLVGAAVKTAADARFRPFGRTGAFLGGDELPYVTGLYVTSTLVQIDGKPQRVRDLVWEVTVASFPDIRGVYWVSADTGAVTQLFPATK